MRDKPSSDSSKPAPTAGTAKKPKKKGNAVSRGFNRMLWMLEKHAVGILVTIVVHLLVICVALVWHISTYRESEQSVLIDFSQFKPDEEPPAPVTEQQETAQEMIQRLNEVHNIRNIPVNRAEKQGEENIRKMESDLKKELNITDPPPPQDEPDEEAIAEEQRKYDAKFPENSDGERTVYNKGNTTVSFYLPDRNHLFMPVPAYKCENAGKVVVNIVVNRRGYVIKCEVDEALSDSDRCLWEASIADAKRTRFNDSDAAPAKQEGNITYVFLAQ